MKALITFAFLITTIVAHAQWSTDATVNNAVGTGSGLQRFVKIVPDNSGGSIMVWVDERNGNFDIYAQRFSATSLPLWTANGVAICTSANMQTNPTIIQDGAGGAIIAWEDDVNGVGLPDIYAQRINASGVVQWTTNGVAVGAATNVQRNASMALISTGDVVIVWEDKRAAGFYDVYAQRINPNGVVQWTANGVVVSTALDDQLTPVVVNAFGGGIFVVWTDFVNAPTTGGDIYMQRFNTSGTALLTANGVAVCSTTAVQRNPKAVYGGSSDVLITWEDFRGGNFDIYAQRVTSAGAQWTTNGVAVSATTGEQAAPVILGLGGTAGAVIAWRDKRGADFDIYAQMITSAGLVQWTANGVPVTSATGDQEAPALVIDEMGDAFVLAWTDWRAGLSSDIYAQRINGSGVVQWAADGVAVSTAANSQAAPVMVNDIAGIAGKTGYIIAWEDGRAGNFDVYAQRLGSNGKLCGNPANPGTITGTANILAGTVNTYSVPAALGATSYAWSLPTDWTGTSLTNSIETTASATSGNIFVSSVNMCGSSVSSSSLPVTVTKQNQTITFNSLAAKAMGDVPFDPGATASSGLAITYTSSNALVATVAGNMITIVGVGTSTITAKQAGNTIYNAAADVPQTLTVTKGDQVITFNVEGSKTFGDGPLTLTATSSSGLPVTLTCPTTSVATLNGNVLTFIAAGSVTVHADQLGNVSYNEAPRVTRVFCVNPPKPTITATGIDTESPTLTSSSTSGNQWFLNDAAVPSGINTALSIAAAGVYKVQATIGGCASAFSNNYTFVITGDLALDQADASVFPNPASDKLLVTVPTSGRKVVSIHTTNGSRRDMKDTDGHEVQFDVGTYAPGIYLVKISTGSSVKLIRFIKN